VRALAQEIARGIAKDLLTQAQDTWTKELETVRTELAESKKKLSGYEEFLQQLTADDEPPPPANSLDELRKEMQPPAWVRTESDRRLWQSLVERDFKARQTQQVLLQELDQLKKAREEEQQLRKRAEEESRANAEARREADKRSLLAALAADLDAIDAEGVRRYFQEDLVWDEKLQQHRLRLPDGKLIDIRVGTRLNPKVVELCPDWLRRPAAAGGGSGAAGGREETPQEALKVAREAMEKAYEDARARPYDQAATAAYMRAKRRVQELEKQTKAA
jgi:hypothetical protein